MSTCNYCLGYDMRQSGNVTETSMFRLRKNPGDRQLLSHTMRTTLPTLGNNISVTYVNIIEQLLTNVLMYVRGILWFSRRYASASADIYL